MLEGMFVTVTGFSHYWDKKPFSIGQQFLCVKDPQNPYDSEAIAVFALGGYKVGYLANGVKTKANGTFSAARIYDRVGSYFFIEVCFSTDTKIICQVVVPCIADPGALEAFLPSESEDDEEVDF